MWPCGNYELRDSDGVECLMLFLLLSLASYFAQQRLQFMVRISGASVRLNVHHWYLGDQADLTFVSAKNSDQLRSNLCVLAMCAFSQPTDIASVCEKVIIPHIQRHPAPLPRHRGQP